MVTNLRGKSRLRYAGSITPTQPVQITRGCLLSMLVTQVVATATPATLTFAPILGAVRIKKVSVWQEQATPSTSHGDSMSFEYLSDLGRPLKVTRSVISSVASPLVVSPPPNSRADMWSSTQPTTASKNEILFQLTYDSAVPTAGTADTLNYILDLDFEYVVSNDYSSKIVATASFHAGAGTPILGLGALPLDVLDTSGSTGAQSLLPLGVTNILKDVAGFSIALSAVVRTN